ncbi:type IV toxin-antitoxin system AbiEi family antitoxin domain-containing protein [Pseudonocardia abyssalis]|uniref:Transcriptional regulator, AbiEi antitoxin, Type IV TA system n=1 Tax=Pseudonocardia abyssalis TaxID=2792008 RepID=A0ABS6UTI5_9PSEU|nr:hypothetical protein [Pseudonocardia abyssalis]MBW0117450.1 hypothetical protein [Pseudonocardia abyssalis]MBW0135574.1 hypothetical protein [Pseudonocardia abyssalis]
MDLPIAGPLLRPRLLAAGVTDDELRRLRRAGELAVLQRGAYADPADPRLERPEGRHALLVAAAVPRVAPDAVLSHVSAVVLLGLPVWNVALGRVHTTRARRSGGVRTGRLHVHTAPLDADEVVEIGGFRATSPARTLADIARTVGFEQAVVILDAALHRHLVTREELCAALERMPRWPGLPAARRAIAFALPGAESPGESRSRVAMARSGVAPPVLQRQVRSPGGDVLGTADFGWPEHGWAGEFDGLVKYGRLLAPGQRPADVLVAEKRREDAMRTALRGLTRWTWGEIDGFTEVARRLPR